MEEPEEIRITPEPAGYKPPPREYLPPPISKKPPVNPADRRFLLILAAVTIGSIAVMMIVALVLLFTVQ